ncbi:MAG: TonB-dependent receptor, partial [Desulfobacterales bacterium]|nr:TonB-dependent receptor [Desulfobacterales bacterium]
ASVYIVTRQDIETYGYRTLPEIIRNIPGLYSIYDYRDSIIGVRGILNDKNIIMMVNGVAMQNPEIKDMMIPAEAIDRIEVVRGPMSVIYGSGAFLGSINIVTNDIPYGEPLSLISGSYGSLDTHKAFVRTSGEKGDLQYIFNAASYGSDGLQYSFDRMLNDEQLSVLEPYKPNIHMQTDGDLDVTAKYLNVSTQYKGGYGDLQYSDWQKGIFDDFSFYDGNKRHLETTTGRIGFQGDVSEAIQFDTKLTYSNINAREHYDSYPPSIYGYGITGNGQGKQKSIEMELDMIWKPISELNMISGITYLTHVDSLYTRRFPAPILFGGNSVDTMYKPDHRETLSWFIQTNYKPMDTLKIIAGARIEQYLKYNTDLSLTYLDYVQTIKYTMNREEDVYFIPRIAAVFSKDNHHIFKLMYGEANKPFSDLEIALIELQRGIIIEHIPEEIETIEMNYIFTKKNTSLSVSLYKNNIENIGAIRFYEQLNGDYLPIRDNSGRMVTFGGEVIITRQCLTNLFIEFSASYQETLDRTHEQRKQPHSPHLLLNAKTDYQWKQFTLSLSALHVSSMRPQMPPPRNPDENSNQINAYDHTIIDFNLRYNLNSTGYFIAFKVSNVLDHEIRYPATDDAQFAYGLLDEGRSFTASAGLKF